jgi:Polysaccharide lyase
VSGARRRGAAAALLAVLLGCGACAGGAAAYRPGAAAPGVPDSACPAQPPAPALTTLDWETRRQQGVPDDPPPGWAAEFATGLVHRDDGEPQIRPARAPDPVRAGGAAARFELERGDPVINHGTRAELATALEPRGADRWYALSIYLPAGWTRDRSPEILAQWHQQASIDGNPPLALATHHGQWELLTARDGHDGGALVGAYRTGRWTDWLVHVRWSTGPDGVVQVWRDGRPVPGYTDIRGPNTYRSPHGIYLKVGIYKWDWSLKRPSDTTRRTMYLDEVRIAATRAGVAIPARPAAACYRPDAAQP